MNQQPFKFVSWVLLVCNFLVFGLSTADSFAQQPMVESFLKSGQLTRGQQELEKHLAANPGDDQARYGLGVVHFLQSVEHLGQSWYKFGIHENMNRVAFFRLPVPKNPNPQPVNYQDIRSVLQTMIERLDEADRVLAEIKSRDVKLPLQLFQIKIDFDQDGKISDAEDLSDIYEEYFGNGFGDDRREVGETVVVFDYSDVEWLRGYTHLIRAMAETILAYDQQPLWDVIGYRVFEKAELRFDFQKEERAERKKNGRGQNNFMFGDQDMILDLIAAVHHCNFKLAAPERMKTAHQHLKQVLVHSRAMWELVMAEMDDDREWIPNPQQTSMVSLTRVSAEMVQSWRTMLDEVDALLDGKKLLPFWRGTDPKKGINLHAVFHQPRDLDVILWIQGSGAVPYLEAGDVTATDTWTRFQQVYGGQLFTFATWFN